MINKRDDHAVDKEIIGGGDNGLKAQVSSEFSGYVNIPFLSRIRISQARRGRI
jgi:hypothetical protein